MRRYVLLLTLMAAAMGVSAQNTPPSPLGVDVQEWQRWQDSLLHELELDFQADTNFHAGNSSNARRLVRQWLKLTKARSQNSIYSLPKAQTVLEANHPHEDAEVQNNELTTPTVAPNVSQEALVGEWEVAYLLLGDSLCTIPDDGDTAGEPDVVVFTPDSCLHFDALFVPVLAQMSGDSGLAARLDSADRKCPNGEESALLKQIRQTMLDGSFDAKQWLKVRYGVLWDTTWIAISCADEMMLLLPTRCVEANGLLCLMVASNVAQYAEYSFEESCLLEVLLPAARAMVEKIVVGMASCGVALKKKEQATAPPPAGERQ